MQRYGHKHNIAILWILVTVLHKVLYVKGLVIRAVLTKGATPSGE